MLKYIARIALLTAALVLPPSPARSQAPVRLEAQAVRTIDSIATAARAQRVETAACVTAYTAEPLTLVTVGPAAYVSADSLTIQTARGTTLCPFGVPTLHTHVAKNSIAEPSLTDLRSKSQSGAPFAFVVVVSDSSWRLVLY